MAGELQAGIDELERIASRRDLTEDLLVEASRFACWAKSPSTTCRSARQMAEAILVGRSRPGRGGPCGGHDRPRLRRLGGRARGRRRRDAARRGPPGRPVAVGDRCGVPTAPACRCADRARRSRRGGPYAIDEAQARIHRRSATLWSAGPAVRRAALHLAAGRLDDASAEADTAVALCTELSTGFFVSAAEAVLGEVALQRGEIRTAADHLGRQQVATTGNRSAVGPGQSGWAAARLAQAAGDDARLGTAVEALFDHGRRHRRLFVDEPGAGAWLTRVLLDIDHNARHRAEVVVLGVEQLAGATPACARWRRLPTTHAACSTVTSPCSSAPLSGTVIHGRQPQRSRTSVRYSTAAAITTTSGRDWRRRSSPTGRQGPMATPGGSRGG